MQKEFFLHQHGLTKKYFTRKKCVNYDKSNLQENSVKGQKDKNSAKKMPQSNIKFQNVLKNATKTRKIGPLLTLLTKQRKIWQRFDPR